MPPKATKGKAAAPPKVDLAGMANKKKMVKKKPPPPPKCFTAEDLEKFRELFNAYDEDGTERIPLDKVPTMLRKLGFNPTGAEIEALYKKCLEDEFVDAIEMYHWFWMIEAKIKFGDSHEEAVTKAMQFLIHDEKEKGIGNIETLQKELQEWGEPLTDLEWIDLPKTALKEKALEFETGEFNYAKFIDKINSRDQKYLPEPVNFWKLDQKTLAAMAKAKRDVETAEMEKKEAERRAKEEYKRQKMIEAGLLQQ